MPKTTIQAARTSMCRYTRMMSIAVYLRRRAVWKTPVAAAQLVMSTHACALAKTTQIQLALTGTGFIRLIVRFAGLSVGATQVFTERLLQS